MASPNAEDLSPCSEVTLLCDDSSTTGLYFQNGCLDTTCAETNETSPCRTGSLEQNKTKFFRILCHLLRPRMKMQVMILQGFWSFHYFNIFFY